MNAIPPLHGLVLAGGASRRMGRDKAALRFHGRTQLEWAFDLVSWHCEHTFVSVRADQSDDQLRASLPRIVDRHADLGPIAGIEAAMAAHPQAAWLVVACDLPLLTDATLAQLVARRGEHAITAFRSAHDGLAEPLCAIYAPEVRTAVLEAIAEGRYCPRKLIARCGVPLLDLPDPAALDNVNTPAELVTAARALGGRSTGTGS